MLRIVKFKTKKIYTYAIFFNFARNVFKRVERHITTGNEV